MSRQSAVKVRIGLNGVLIVRNLVFERVQISASYGKQGRISPKGAPKRRQDLFIGEIPPFIAGIWEAIGQI